MIEPYMAVGLVTTVRGVQKRADIRRNIDHIHGVMKAASWLSSLDAPNTGTYFLSPDSQWPVDTFGGRSFIFDFRGRIVGRHEYGGGSSYVAGVIDMEALRDLR